MITFCWFPIVISSNNVVIFICNDTNLHYPDNADNGGNAVNNPQCLMYMAFVVLSVLEPKDNFFIIHKIILFGVLHNYKLLQLWFDAL